MEIKVLLFTGDFRRVSAYADACDKFNAAGEDVSIAIVATANSITIADAGQAQNQPDLIIVDADRLQDGVILDWLIKKRDQYLDNQPGAPAIMALYSNEKQLDLFQRRGLPPFIRHSPTSAEEFNLLIAEIPSFLERAERERYEAGHIKRIDASVLQSIQNMGWRREIVTFWSPTGGVGRSLLAREVALALSAVGKASVLLIDATPNGHQKLLFGLRSSNNLFSLANLYSANQRALSEVMINNHLVAYKNYPLKVLLGVSTPVQYVQPIMAASGAKTGGESVTLSGALGAELLEKILGWANGHDFDFVIIDAGSRHYERLPYKSLSAATRVICVSTPELTAIGDMMAAIAEIREYASKDPSIKTSKFAWVVNRYDPSANVKLPDVATALGFPLAASIPMIPTNLIYESVNFTAPFVTSNEQSYKEWAKHFFTIATMLYPPLSGILEGKSVPWGRSQDVAAEREHGGFLSKLIRRPAK